MLIIEPGLSEGIYMASGGGAKWTGTAKVHQNEETGRKNHVLQVDLYRSGTDSSERIITIIFTFSQTVTFNKIDGRFKLVGSNTGTVITVQSNSLHVNSGDHIGFGDFTVTTDTEVILLDPTVIVYES